MAQGLRAQQFANGHSGEVGIHDMTSAKDIASVCKGSGIGKGWRAVNVLLSNMKNEHDISHKDSRYVHCT